MLISTEVEMDVVKIEPDVNPLPVQSSDTEEKNHLSEAGQLLDLNVTGMKEECVDDSYDHTSEIKFEEILLPNNYPVVKCEVVARSTLSNMERELKDVVKLKLLNKEYKLSAKEGMKSDVWDKFLLVTSQDDKKVGYVSCKHCSTLLSFSSSTTHLKTHVCKFRPETRRSDYVPIDMKQSVTQKCVEMCMSDLCPFNIVSGTGFQKYSQELINIGADYGRVNVTDILPHPTTISRHIQARADEIREKVMPKIIDAAENSGCACTADLWADPYKNRSFLTITAHFIDDEWSLKSCVLATTQFPGKSKTGGNIREEIEEKMTELGIFPEHMEKISFVIDQGPSIRKALENYSCFPCIAHCLNTVLRHLFDETFLKNELPTCQRTIDAAKHVIRYMKETGAVECLQNTLKQEVDTKWSSLYTMLNSFCVEYDKVVEVLTQKNAAEELQDYDNNLALHIRDFLQPFTEATNSLQVDTYPTIQLVLLWVHKLKKHCAITGEEIKEITKLKERALRLLEDKVIIEDIHKIGTFLWPSFRKLKQLSALEREETLCTVRRMCSEVETSVGALSDMHQVPSPIKKLKSMFAEDGDEPTGNEIDLYIKREHVDDDEPLRWWKKNSDVYPRLAEVARRIFCIPATNAASERNFSAAGNLILDKRSMLDADRVNDVLFIHSIGKKFNV